MGQHHRVLIVGTIPYNKNTPSRAFDAYFHNWEKENIRQVFSNTKTPVKGHCASLYQITDQRLLKRRLGKLSEVGVIYAYDDLPEDWKDNDLEVGSSFVSFLYRFGSKDTPLKYLLRKWVWKEKYWNTKQFRDWLDEFQPECVFLAFSDDFFIPEIALFAAARYGVPIMSCIGDDYYFNDKFSLSPFYYIYRSKYKKLIRRVFAHKGSAIYIGDKIRDKYNKEFGLNGETVYLTSDIQRRPFRPVDRAHPRITYCGNIRLGRNESLAEIGAALVRIDPTYRLEVYSAEKNEEFIKVLRGKPGIDYKGAVPYREVMQVMHDSDVVVIVEGFKPKDVKITRYSLSTKAADAMATGAQILVYGSLDCGVIEYMASTGCAVVCSDKASLEENVRRLIEDTALQEKLYEQSGKMSVEHHSKERNLTLSESMFDHLIEDGDA
ncbi:MAG: glycosyltransferase [Clostridia bacterium]|nr:glycosyltransferase [Clostridia bacterium]